MEAMLGHRHGALQVRFSGREFLCIKGMRANDRLLTTSRLAHDGS